jgi:hypothetical protein
VQCRHRSWLDPPAKAITHNQIVSFSQSNEKRHQVCEIVAVIGVPHDDVIRASRLNTCNESAAITAICHPDNAGAKTSRNFYRVISAPIIRDHDLASDLLNPQEFLSLFDTSAESLRFI